MACNTVPRPNQEILWPETPEKENDAWLETNSDGPQTQESSGLRPLSQESVYTVCCESSASPEITGADTQQYSCFQPDGVSTEAPTDPQDVAATVPLQEPSGAMPEGAYDD
jgi:hypothetical protein